MKIDIGFSPCPNDTFIFDALVNNRINTRGHEFNPVMEDVQTLNQWAIEGKLPITKISFGVLPLITNHYQVLAAGSALGRGVGPLLIAANNEVIDPEDISAYTIAIPGENTTAHLLFKLAYPNHTKKVFVRYNEVESFVLESSEQDLRMGVIIHENRFTYFDKGLQKIIDLGDFWEMETGHPIPLGGIVVKRDLHESVKSVINELIRISLEHSWTHDRHLSKFIRTNAQEMDEAVMRSHIELYVNDFTKDLGKTGREAILKLLKVYHDGNTDFRRDIFYDDEIFRSLP